MSLALAHLMNDRDIWLTANLMIKQYGDNAAIEVAMRAEDLQKRGDLGGTNVWRRVLSAVAELTVKMVVGSMH